MNEQDQGRCPAGGRHRPPRLVLLLVAVVAACGPAPAPTLEASPPSPTPTPTAAPSPLPSLAVAPPDDRLVVLARADDGSRLVTWVDGRLVVVPLPGPDAHGLAVGPTGRAAAVAGNAVFVADALGPGASDWKPVDAFRAGPDDVVYGLAWSSAGALAAARAAQPATPPFFVVAGRPGETPVEIEVEAGLDGTPAWLDGDRVAVVAVRDPYAVLAIVSVGSGRVEFLPMDVAALAVAPDADLVAVGMRSAARVELRRLADLAGAMAPIAVVEGPEAAIVGALALSADGAWLAVAWLGADGPVVGLYDRSSGWREHGRLGVAALGLDGARPALELAWRP